MMFKFTEEDIEIIEDYRENSKLMVNQLLINNGELDVALLRDKTEDMQPFSYDRESVRVALEKLIRIYEIMLKYFYAKERKPWTLAYNTTVSETERLKNEIYIDYFLHATSKQEDVEAYIETELPAIMNFVGDVDVPYLNIDEVLEIETDMPEMLIAPFTKIKDFKDIKLIKLDDGRRLPIYSITLEKQDLQELTEQEKDAVYNYILTSADVVDQKLKECADYDKNNFENNENIRKLEQLLAKYEDRKSVV